MILTEDLRKNRLKFKNIINVFIDLYISSGVIDSYDEVDKTVVVKLSKDFMNYKNVGISIFYYKYACNIL